MIDPCFSAGIRAWSGSTIAGTVHDMRVASAWKYLFAGAVGALLAFFVMSSRGSLPAAIDSKAEASNSHAPFVLAIRIKLKPGLKKAWLDRWKVLAEYVRSSEPDTLAYEASVLEDYPDDIFVYERYTTKEALTEVHQKSSAFLDFKADMESMDPYLNKEGYGATETGIGHMLPQNFKT